MGFHWVGVPLCLIGGGLIEFNWGRGLGPMGFHWGGIPWGSIGGGGDSGGPIVLNCGGPAGFNWGGVPLCLTGGVSRLIGGESMQFKWGGSHYV